MKKYYLFASLVLIAASPSFAQTKIGAPGAPDPSAMLEVTSGTSGNKGLLLPRMTTTQRNAITSPATGLMIYNTTTNQTQVNTGTPAAPIWVVATATNSDWDLVGNSGTTPATNFLGTTDNQPLAIRTNNTEKVRVTAAGNVGVGTNAPAARLHVVDTGDVALRIGNSGGTSGHIQLGNDNHGLMRDLTSSGGTINDVALYTSTGVTPGTNSSLYLVSKPTSNGSGSLPLDQFVLKNTGDVGIGTNTPAQKLHVQGTARISTATGTPTTITGRNAAGDVGNVAIGSGLSLTGGTLSATATTDNTDWNLTGNTGTNPATNFIGTADSQSLVIRTNNTEKVRVTAAGNVGIGNTAPAFTLDVNGSIRINTDVLPASNSGSAMVWNSVNSGQGETELINYKGTGGGGFRFHSLAPGVVPAAGVGELMRITGTGSVGIGTSAPAQTLHVAGTARISTAVGTPTTITGRNAAGDVGNVTVGAGLDLAGGVLTATGAGNNWGVTGNTGINPASNFLGTTNLQPLIVRTDNTERLRVTPTGNVGIGTASPAAQLHVSDTGNASVLVSTSSNKQMRVLLGSANHGIIRNLTTSGGKANDVALYTSSGTGATAAGDVYLVANPVVSASDSLPIDQFVLKNTGNVGIGTNTPAQKLHVQGTARISTATGTPTTITGRDADGDVGNVAIGSGLSLTGGTLSATATTDNTDWNLTGNAGTNPATNFIGTSDAQPLVIRTDNTEQIRVTAAGNMGIGTAAPTQKLDVVGSARIRVATGTPTTIAGRDNIGNVGDVAVGTGLTLTAGTLSVTGGTNDWDLTGNAGTNPSTNFIGTSDAQPLVIRTNNTEKLRVTAAGNVGIGIATPAFALDVNGSIKANTDALPASTAGSAMAWNSVNSGQGATEFVNYKGTGGGGYRFYSVAPSVVPAAGVGELMRITGTGNVGINNSNPLSPLSFASALGSKITYWDGGSTTNHFGIGVSNNQLNYHAMPGAAHTFYTGGLNGNGTELMRILSNGNVGIGTSTPSTKLTVNGGSLSVTTDATSPNISAPVINVINNGGGSLYNDDVEIYSYGDSTAPEFGMWTARGTATAPLNSQANDYAGIIRFGTQVNGARTELVRIQSTYTGNGTTEDSRLTFHAKGESYPPLMTMLSNGNVGIGTLSPTAMLSVNGAANNTTGTWSIFSDARVKTVDGEYEDGLATVMKIHPVKFHYNANAPFKSKEQQIGIIAQEIEQIAPYMVSKVNADGFTDLRQYNNQALPYMLVNAIQEQQAQIEALKAENKELKESNKITAQLMERVKQMEQMMGINEIEGTSKVAGK